MLLRSIATFFVALILFTGCSRKEAKRSTLRLNFSCDVETLDPRKTYDETSANLLNMLYEGLLRTGPDGSLQPGLAEHYEISPDGLTYTFFLRDALWSDGSAVTAYDFEYSLKRILSPNFLTKVKSKLYPIRGAEAAATGRGLIEGVGIHALSEKKLQIELARPTPYFLNLVAMWNYFPVRAQIDETTPSWPRQIAAQSYCGPFILKEHKPDNCLILEKNPLYWDVANIAIDRVEISMTVDAHTELELFEQGELDWAGQPLSRGLPLDSLDPLKRRGLLQAASPNKVYYYLFNTQKAPFNNEKMRRAFSYAICRSEIVDFVAGSGNRPALSFVPPAYVNASEELFSDGDVAEAKRLFNEALEEMGSSRASLPKISISLYRSPVQEKVVQTIARQWEKAFGIPIEIEIAEWSVHVAKIGSRDFQVLCVNWFPDFPDAMCFLDAFDSAGDDVTGWLSPKYSNLLGRAKLTSSYATRTHILSDAEKMLAEAMPAAPLYYNGPAYVVSDRLTGAFVTEFNMVELKWAKFTAEGNAL